VGDEDSKNNVMNLSVDCLIPEIQMNISALKEIPGNVSALVDVYQTC